MNGTQNVEVFKQSVVPTTKHLVHVATYCLVGCKSLRNTAVSIRKLQIVEIFTLKIQFVEVKFLLYKTFN